MHCLALCAEWIGQIDREEQTERGGSHFNVFKSQSSSHHYKCTVLFLVVIADFKKNIFLSKFRSTDDLIQSVLLCHFCSCQSKLDQRRLLGIGLTFTTAVKSLVLKFTIHKILLFLPIYRVNSGK